MRFLLILVAAIVLLAGTAPAFAQTAPDNDPLWIFGPWKYVAIAAAAVDTVALSTYSVPYRGTGLDRAGTSLEYKSVTLYSDAIDFEAAHPFRMKIIDRANNAETVFALRDTSLVNSFFRGVGEPYAMQCLDDKPVKYTYQGFADSLMVVGTDTDTLWYREKFLRSALK